MRETILAAWAVIGPSAGFLVGLFWAGRRLAELEQRLLDDEAFWND